MVECNPPKVEVAGSTPVSRSIKNTRPGVLNTRPRGVFVFGVDAVDFVDRVDADEKNSLVSTVLRGNAYLQRLAVPGAVARITLQVEISVSTI